MSVTSNNINIQNDILNRKIKQSEIYDPRIIDEENTSRQIWTSESVYLANKGLVEGYKLKENPYLKSVRGALLRKAGLSFQFTEEEKDIYTICFKDKLFFLNNFLHLKDAEKGWEQVKLRDYQEELVKRYKKHRWNIIMFPRQSGKTTTTVGEIVHFATFNFDKDIVTESQDIFMEFIDILERHFHFDAIGLAFEIYGFVDGFLLGIEVFYES